MGLGSKDNGGDREGIVEERMRDGFDQDTFNICVQNSQGSRVL